MVLTEMGSHARVMFEKLIWSIDKMHRAGHPPLDYGLPGDPRALPG